jgi:hypothetical protein
MLFFDVLPGLRRLLLMKLAGVPVTLDVDDDGVSDTPS